MAEFFLQILEHIGQEHATCFSWKTVKISILNMQARAFKLIFGWNVSYRVALLASGAERLEDRRKVLVDNFAKKCLKNLRFVNCFPLNRDALYPTRRREKFFIKQSQTTRHQKTHLIIWEGEWMSCTWLIKNINNRA